MKLRSQYKGNVFWRIFDMSDTVHIIGYSNGFVYEGGTVDITHPHGQFQLELKEDWFWGRSI